MEQETIDMYCIYEDGNWVIDGVNFYDVIDKPTDNNEDDVFSAYAELFRTGETKSGLEIAYYSYIDLNDDELPELLVADADGTPNSWSVCEIYTYRNNEVCLCGSTNTRYDYFYLVNNKYVLGKHRMGDQYISVDNSSSPSSIETSEPITLIQNNFVKFDYIE